MHLLAGELGRSFGGEEDAWKWISEIGGVGRFDLSPDVDSGKARTMLRKSCSGDGRDFDEEWERGVISWQGSVIEPWSVEVTAREPNCRAPVAIPEGVEWTATGGCFPVIPNPRPKIPGQDGGDSQIGFLLSYTPTLSLNVKSTVDLVIVADNTDAAQGITPRWTSPVMTLWSTVVRVRFSAELSPSVRVIETLLRAVEFGLRFRYSAELFTARTRFSAAKLDPWYYFDRYRMLTVSRGSSRTREIFR